jgi:hypothetical protein
MVEARMLAGVHFIEMLTAGAKTQERLPLVVALNPQRGDAADFIALFQGLRTKARIIAPYADAQNGHFGWYRGESSAAGAPGPRRAAQTLVPFLGQMHDAWPSVGEPDIPEMGIPSRWLEAYRELESLLGQKKRFAFASAKVTGQAQGAERLDERKTFDQVFAAIGLTPKQSKGRQR